MKRREAYQRLLNSKEWKTLRAWYLNLHPCCERCREEGIAAGILPDGYVRSAIDVHHIVPVESAKSEEEMKLLCFNPNNLKALCIPCHVKTHKEMRSCTKPQVVQRKRQEFEIWKATHTGSQSDGEGSTQHSGEVFLS